MTSLTLNVVVNVIQTVLLIGVLFALRVRHLIIKEFMDLMNEVTRTLENLHAREEEFLDAD